MLFDWWLCSLGVILYNTATPYPKITRFPRPRTPTNTISIRLQFAKILSYVCIMEWLDSFANFLSTLYSILHR